MLKFSRLLLLLSLLFISGSYSLDQGKKKKINKAKQEKEEQGIQEPKLIKTCEYLEGCKQCNFKELQEVNEC